MNDFTPDESQLSDDKLDELYEKILQQDPDQAVDEDVARARAALNMIHQVRDLGQMDTQRLQDTEPVGHIFSEIDGELEISLPDTIGRFEIKQSIGKGGFGMVLLAHDPNLGRDVALKIPRPEVITTPDLKSRFLREGRAAAALAHPNIVPVYEAGQIGSICYLASQYVDGESLADWAARQNKISAKQAAEICQAIAEGLAHAHQRGVLHRDVKPANILVSQPKQNAERTSASLSSRIQITDFGLAKTLDDDSQQTKSGALIGTPSYMSPEQAGQKPATSSSDVYSVGAVLYFLLTGKPTFLGDSVIQTIQQVINSEPVAPSKLNSAAPVDLEAICLKCLEKNPENRYLSAFGLCADLIRFQNGEPVNARPVTELNRFIRWTRRNPLIAGSLSAAFLFLAAGLVASAVGWISTSRALERESTALSNETAALRNEKKANLQARERYLAHKEAIDVYFVNVSENKVLKNTPGAKPLRQDLLSLALNYYEQYVSERQHDPDLAADVGEAETRIAKIFQEMEENEIALEHASLAVELLNAAMETEQSDELTYLKSQALYQVFQATRGLGKSDEAVPVLVESIELLETLAEDQNNINANMKWAQYTADYGVLLQLTGKMNEAKAKFEEAALIYESTRLLSDSPEIQLKRIKIKGSLAVFQKQSGNIDGAIEDLKLVFEELSDFVQANPNDWEATESYVITGLNLGYSLLMKHQSDEAAKYLNDSNHASKRLHFLFPSSEKYVNFRAGCFARLAMLLEQTGDTEGELELLAKGADFYREKVNQNPGSIRFKSMLCDGLINWTTIRTRERADLDEAAADNDYAIELLREMVRAAPDYVNHQVSLAAGLRSRSLLQLLAKRYEKAIEPIEETIEICDQLIQNNTRAHVVRDFRMDAYIFSGKAYYNLEQFEKAAAAWKLALKSEAPSLPKLKDDLTISLACALEKTGVHLPAQDAIDSIDTEKLKPKDMVTLAQYYSILASNREIGAPDLETASQWVQKALEQDYFSKEWQVVEFESKNAFEELRKLPEIQSLLEVIRSKFN